MSISSKLQRLLIQAWSEIFVVERIYDHNRYALLSLSKMANCWYQCTCVPTPAFDNNSSQKCHEKILRHLLDASLDDIKVEN